MARDHVHDTSHAARVHLPGAAGAAARTHLQDGRLTDAIAGARLVVPRLLVVRHALGGATIGAGVGAGDADGAQDALHGQAAGVLGRGEAAAVAVARLHEAGGAFTLVRELAVAGRAQDVPGRALHTPILRMLDLGEFVAD